MPTNATHVRFNPEEISALRSALDAAWASLSPKLQSETAKSELAEHILKLAADGERDPLRLRNYAVVKIKSRVFGFRLAS